MSFSFFSKKVYLLIEIILVLVFSILVLPYLGIPDKYDTYIYWVLFILLFLVLLLLIIFIKLKKQNYGQE